MKIVTLDKQTEENAKKEPAVNGKPEKLIPHSLEAEEAVLGALLIDSEAILQVASFLKPEDFYIVRNGWIYDAIFSLHERNQATDLLTVCDELENRGQINEVGVKYLSQIVNSVPTAVHVEAYAHIVERTAIRRRLITTAGEIAGLGYQEDKSIDDVLDQAEVKLFAVSQERIADGPVKANRIIADYYDHMEAMHVNGGVDKIPSGFVDLDSIIGGFHRSDFIIIAARPGVGKTSFLLNIALRAAKEYNKTVGIFSLEMSSEQLIQRLISTESGIDGHKLRLGKMRDEEWPKFAEASGILSEIGLFVDDTPGLSAMQLRTRVRRLHAEHGLDMVLVDYLQLMSGDKRHDTEYQEITYISKMLKNLAREINVPLIAASQLSRAVEQRSDKHPILSDLRSSGSLEQDSDIVMFLYRDELYNPDTELKNIADLQVAKHRHGPTGTVQLFFRKHLTQFVDAEVYHRNLGVLKY